MAESKESVVGHYARATLGVVLVLAAVAAAWNVRQVLLLVLISLVLAVGLDPGVRWLQRRFEVRRGAGVAVIMVGTVFFLALLLALVIPPIVREVQDLARDLPGYVKQVQESRGFVGDLERRFQLGDRLQELSKDIPKFASASFATILSFTRSVTGGIFSFVTIVVLTIYFMASMPRLKDGLASLFPGEEQEDHRRLLEEATGRIGGYVSGQLTISVIAGVVSFVAFLIIDVPFPAALAMVVAITDLIPSVGALIGAVICTAVAAFNGVSPAVFTAGYLLVYQQVENYVISPRVMKKAVDLSPAAVIISILIGGSLIGFVGALLALPIAAAAKVVVRDLWLGPRIEKVRKAREYETQKRSQTGGRTRSKRTPAPASSEGTEDES